MNENVDLTLVALGLLVFSAHLFASLYSRRMVPDVLFLILIGLLLGPIFHLITPTDLGVVGPVFVAVTLVVILFEGGTSLSLKVMQDSWKSTMKLTTTGFFASMIVVAVIAKYFLDFPWTQAFLLGSILGGTSSAVVIPLVKQLKIGEESRTVLVLESALTDVFCIVFALVFLEIYHSSHINIGLVFGQILGSFTFSGLIGIAGGLVWSRILEKVRKIQNSIFTTPAFVFIIYGITQVLGYSGAIAALTFGITMSNINTFQNRLITNLIGPVGHELNETEKVFFSEIVFLFKTFFFVYIGISIMFDNINAIYCGLIITGILLLSRLFIAYFLFSG